MNTFTKRLLGLALGGMILGACSQTATFEDADLMNEQASAEKGGFNLNPFSANGFENAKTYASNSWETGCVPGNGAFINGDFYELTFSPVPVSWGSNKLKTGNLTVYNTATKFVFRISSTVDIKDLIINDVSTGFQASANTTGVYEIDLPSDWKAGDDYVFTVKYAGDGPQIIFPQTTYEYVGICTTTTLSEGTAEPICEDTPFSLTATVSTAFGDVTGGFIQILNSLNEVVASEPVTSGNKQVTYSVPTETAGDYTYTARYVRSDPSFRYQGSVSATSSTINVIECGGCDIEGNEFSGVSVSCAQTNREAIYTFGSEDGVGYFKMQGGLNNFTGSNASVYINNTLVNFNSLSDDEWETGVVGGFIVGQRTPGKSSNRNIRVEGSLGECSEVVVKIVWNSDNAGSTITGSWSVKDISEVDLAPEVADLSCD